MANIQQKALWTSQVSTAIHCFLTADVQWTPGGKEIHLFYVTYFLYTLALSRVIDILIRVKSFRKELCMCLPPAVWCEYYMLPQWGPHILTILINMIHPQKHWKCDPSYFRRNKNLQFSLKMTYIGIFFHPWEHYTYELTVPRPVSTTF